jgi:Tol biopolymer transport system component
VVVLAAVVFAWWRIPPAAPVVESVTQLTDDGLAKEGKLATDGSRIYFNEGQTGTWKVAQVSVTGGRTAPVDTKLVNSHVAALAPDGSTLLALVGDGFENPLWSIALPAGEPRRIGSANVQDADFSPDGRIIFARERDLYVADKDGSNPHKLISMAHEVLYPSVSPDGKRIVFRAEVGDGNSLFEIAMDGTSLRKVLSYSHDVQPWCGGWSSDGRYFIYRASQGDARDIWALPMRTGLLHRLGEPFRLTAGPLLYTGVLPSRDGKQIFAIGTKRRGELVHYDLKSQQFLPFLSGISAMDPTFSRDGKWVAYASYPDRSLWRSRSDGTERAQLTYPPMKAFYPFISPDGTRVVFTTLPGEIYVVSMDGGAPQRVVEKGSGFANWSPDGNLLVMMSVDENKPAADKSAYTLDILDLRTGKTSRVPSSSQGLVGALWINQNTLIAARDHGTKFVTIDLKTQKWTELAVGNFVSWHVSPDGRYLCFTVGGAEPKAQRLRFSDRQIETITSLKDLRQAVDSIEETQISIAPDGSAIFTRDIGSQEIYALNVRWP